MTGRVLVVHPSLTPRGGGNAVAAWALQALVERFDVSLLTGPRVDCAALNAHYGTSLSPDSFRQINVARLDPLGDRVLDIRLRLISRRRLMRRARKIIDAFDVAISTENEIDIGRRAIQYVHYPWGITPHTASGRRGRAVRLYRNILDAIAPASDEGAGRNLSLVNSHWTGERFRERYGEPALTLYPPVDFVRHAVPRTPAAFVTIAVLNPHKRIERVLKIFDRVQERAPRSTLHIIGSTGHHRAYVRRLESLVRERPDVTLHVDVSRGELTRIVSGCTFGIHAMRDEHFGIAVAEMTTAGLVTFVPRGGGQMEIVGGDERLIYDDTEDAVSKIVSVLENEQLEAELRRKLTERAKEFSRENFSRRLVSIVEAFVNEQRERSR